MTELQELYQEVILDHNKRPRNFGKMENADRHAEGYNPLCGDQMSVYLKTRNGILEDIRFEGSGCAISKASASLMTTALKGKTMDEAREIFDRFHGVITGSSNADTEELGKLAVLAGVREFPSRVKCASLAWHTLNAALENEPEPVSTE